MPPAGSAPVVRAIELRFPRQGNVSVIEPQTYLYYIQTRGEPPLGERLGALRASRAFSTTSRRLWNTNFLDDLWIEVNDVPYPNGVVGKHIVFNMEERQRIKIVDYVGTKVLEQTKIDEKLKEKGVTIRLDSFIDPALVNKRDGHRPGDALGEGVPGRPRHARDQAHRRRPEARPPDLHHRRGAQVQDP